MNRLIESIFICGGFRPGDNTFFSDKLEEALKMCENRWKNIFKRI